MISHKHRCIFVHIPKTAGTSIEDVIWPKPRATEDLWMGFTEPHRNKYQTGGLQHLCAHQIRQEVGATVFDQFFKFSIVRNPWDRLVSQYAYLPSRPDLQEYLRVSAAAPFSEYIETIGGSDHVQVMPQTQFLSNGSDASIVDFIGRFENLVDDAAYIFERLGMEGTPLPHRNPSKRMKDYRDYYTAETRDRVAEIYAEDIRVFGYEF
jgi:hypothetical protein